MGLMNRLKRVTIARIESFLSTVEDPEVILPQLINEMVDGVAQAKAAEVTASAAVKSAQRKVDEISGRLMRLERGAALAIEHKDEATAREALSEQLSVERMREELLKPLKDALSAAEMAKSVRVQLEDELAQIRAKKSEIIARSRTIKIRANVSAARGDGVSSILDQVSRLEANLEEEEAALDVHASVGRTNESLEERLRKLESASEVDVRMQALRDKISKEEP